MITPSQAAQCVAIRILCERQQKRQFQFQFQLQLQYQQKSEEDKKKQKFWTYAKLPSSFPMVVGVAG
jgi:hypothetical protein